MTCFDFSTEIVNAQKVPPFSTKIPLVYSSYFLLIANYDSV